MSRHETKNVENNDADKELKKRLVLETIQSHCTKDSEFQDFRTIANSLEDGDNLDIKIISGGLTNFSYKIFLHSDESKAPLFAKVTFPRAFWNPDPSVHYDLERTENEFFIMKKICDIVPDAPIATPYLCISMDNMKLLVTEWSSKTDEQWGNQFIDGSIDMRVIPKLAEMLAILHCQDFDPGFNENVRPCMMTLFPTMTKRIDEIFKDKNIEGRTTSLARDYGKEVCYRLVDKVIESYNTRDCLVHSDVHPFNILVERKQEDENFGPNGDMVLCDWEMAFAGPIGRDLGLTYAWPICCMLAHALNGHEEVVDSVWKALELLWVEYSSGLSKIGEKDGTFLSNTYQNILGWCGCFLFLYYHALAGTGEYLPIESKNDKSTVIDSIGTVGLKLMKQGFETKQGKSIQEYQTIFKEGLKQEVDFLLDIASSRKQAQGPRRRSSILRSSGRRLSDTDIHFSGSSLMHLSSFVDDLQEDI